MPDSKQRARSIQDLKNRLGRGAGQPSSNPPPPAGSGLPGSRPVGSGSVPPTGQTLQGVPAPAFLPPPGVIPASTAGLPMSFGQPAGFVMPSSNADPFAAATAPAGRQDVRLVLDDNPVDDAEVGRKRRGRNFLLITLGLLVGSAVGYGSGNVMSDRRAYNAAVQDGVGVYQQVRTASGKVEEASKLIDRALRQARGTPDRAPSIDYGAIEALRIMAQPFTANAFARKRYSNFKASTVDALFDYYGKVGTMWEKFATLASRTLPPQRRAELEAAANAVSGIAQTQTGCVPVYVEGRLTCELVFVALPNKPAADRDKQADGTPLQVTVSSTRRGASSTKLVYSGQDLKVDPGQFVILTHTPKSVGVLGQQASLFAEYQRDLLALRQLASAALEVQGRLERELGEVASLKSVSAF